MSEKQLESKVQQQTVMLLNSVNPEERAEICTYILGNIQVAQLVMMLLAEAVKPILPESAQVH